MIGQLPLTDERWNTILTRDKAADGTFVLGVRTTGVYCRPSCHSRTPKRENVQVFAVPAAAEQAGFRACKRCHPTELKMPDPKLALAQAVCARIQTALDAGDEASVCSLDALGAQFGYDPTHLSDTFKSVLGITPRQYADAYRMERFKRGLRSSGSVTEAIHDAGYGSSSRVYERSDAALGMTPATYSRGGKGAQISFTAAQTAFGWLLVATTARGVCCVQLHGSIEQAEEALYHEFPQALITRDDSALLPTINAILDHIGGVRPDLDLALDIQATAFQWRVWRALQAIPRGEKRTYAQIAAEIGQPKAVRAVANACASNQAAIVIPCHRVVGTDGGLHGYRWGVERKHALLEAEALEQTN